MRIEIAGSGYKEEVRRGTRRIFNLEEGFWTIHEMERKKAFKG